MITPVITMRAAYARIFPAMVFSILLIFDMSVSFRWSGGRPPRGSAQFSLPEANEVPEYTSEHDAIRSLRDRSKYLSLNTLSAITSLALPLLCSASSVAAATAPAARIDDFIVLPMQPYDGVFTVNYTINDVSFRAIVDSGSPFLIVPSVCSKMWGGCSQRGRFDLLPTDLEDTIEIFGGQNYDTVWRKTYIEVDSLPTIAPRLPRFQQLRFPATPAANAAATAAAVTNSRERRRFENLIVASVGPQILLPPGGVFFGLIKYKSKAIRPTLLSQLGYSSFCFDSRGRRLTLSRRALLPPARVAPPTVDPTPAPAPAQASGAVPTVKLVDLRPLGDPVCHYAAPVKALEINGQPVAVGSTVYAVFDTGTSGCLIR